MHGIEEEVRKRVDKHSQEYLSKADTKRYHLGPSEMGSPCSRKVWYGWRWMLRGVKHTGRMMRLFNRGHLEEVRVCVWLRASGFQVREYAQRLVWFPASNTYKAVEWVDPIPEGAHDVSIYDHHHQVAKEYSVRCRQWGFIAIGGHHKGSNDGKIMFPDDMAGAPGGWGGMEFKTHNDKSFNLVKTKGVVSAKLEHYVQTQIYMHRLKLPWSLYIAVNKNDDEIYYEVIRYREELALQYAQRAESIIFARNAPKRITDDPSWFQCKFCDFRGVCHYEEAPALNCRSCAKLEAKPDGTWYCHQYHQTPPKHFLEVGCEKWEQIK